MLPASYAPDDGAGLLYRNTELVEAVAENDTAGAYFVREASDDIGFALTGGGTS